MVYLRKLSWRFILAVNHAHRLAPPHSEANEAPIVALLHWPPEGSWTPGSHPKDQVCRQHQCPAWGGRSFRYSACDAPMGAQVDPRKAAVLLARGRDSDSAAVDAIYGRICATVAHRALHQNTHARVEGPGGHSWRNRARGAAE